MGPIMKTILTAVLICVTMASTAFARDTIVLKAELQAAIQTHIDRSAIDGALPFMNLETGKVEPLYPTEAHPLILTMGESFVGESFVLCADLRTADGAKRIVDFYLTHAGKRYKIIRTEIDNRAPLKALMSAGIAKRLR